MATGGKNQKHISVIWTKEEDRDWDVLLLQTFDILLGDDPLPPVDKSIDLMPNKPHHLGVDH